MVEISMRIIETLGLLNSVFGFLLDVALNATNRNDSDNLLAWLQEVILKNYTKEICD